MSEGLSLAAYHPSRCFGRFSSIDARFAFFLRFLEVDAFIVDFFYFTFLLLSSWSVSTMLKMGEPRNCEQRAGFLAAVGERMPLERSAWQGSRDPASGGAVAQRSWRGTARSVRPRQLAQARGTFGFQRQILPTSVRGQRGSLLFRRRVLERPHLSPIYESSDGPVTCQPLVVRRRLSLD